MEWPAGKFENLKMGIRKIVIALFMLGLLPVMAQKKSTVP